jgi:hypothetical protein
MGGRCDESSMSIEKRDVVDISGDEGSICGRPWVLCWLASGERGVAIGRNPAPAWEQ